MITKTQISNWRKMRGKGMTSAVGEYTPREFWDVLDEVDRLQNQLIEAREEIKRWEKKWDDLPWNDDF